LDIRLQGIVVIVGNYGSGKTEVAINLALACRQTEGPVRVVDLDLVNPYFRTREARALLQANKVDIVLPPTPYLHADLPIVTPAVAGAIRQPGPLTILDVGGDDAGATVLASLADAFRGQSVEMLQVINPHRPLTDTVAGCLAMRAQIEAASHLTVTGWIGNAHMMEATSVDTVRAGYRFASEVSHASGLPLAFITAPKGLMGDLTDDVFGCPVLPIQRRLTLPWQAAQSPTKTTSGPIEGSAG
jgi:energy-coupling factor transporter ATP-binding protein EcfA2